MAREKTTQGPIKGPTSGWLCTGGLHLRMFPLLGQHSGHLTVMFTFREGRQAGGGFERQNLLLQLRAHPSVQGPHTSTTPGAPTWNGHMPDQDRVQEAGHRQQHVGEELLEAAQPVGLLLCSVCPRPRLAPGGWSSALSG